MISKIICLIFLVTTMGGWIKIRFRMACLLMLGDPFLDGVLGREIDFSQTTAGTGDTRHAKSKGKLNA